MKDSGIEWIGEIPEGWELVKLKYLSAFPVEKNIDPNSPYIGLENIESWSGKYIPSNSQFDKSQALIFSKGDILFGKLRPYLAKVFFAFDSGCCSSEFCIMTFSSNLNAHYYWNILISPTFINEVTQSTYGTKMPRANTDFIRNIFVPVPSKNDQNQIAEYLNIECSHIDAILSKTRDSIEEYKKLKQAVITQAVTKGVRGEREMKDSKIDYIEQIPDEWVLCKLRNIGDAQNGISKSSDFFGKGAPFVSYSDVYKNYSLPFSVSGLVESTPAEQERYSVKEGDIFFTRTSETIEEVGYSCVCEKDIPHATFAGFLIRVRPFSDELYTPYAKYYFRSSHLRFYLVKEMNLVTRASLGQSLLKSMPVLLPSLEEQKEIADYLDAKCTEINGLIAKKEQLVKELESYKKSLIYEVVTGKREV